MKPIHLTRTILVHTFDTQATVAVARHRPEWLAVVRLAKDFGGEITADQVSQELLAGLPVGQKVIQRCNALGLLEVIPDTSSARLTPLGESSLERDQVFVPEQRLWRFYYAADPLLRQPLLHIEPLESGSASDERREMQEARRTGSQRLVESDNCPKLICENCEVLVSSAVAGGSAFIIKQIAASGHSNQAGQIVLSLEWAVGDSSPSIHLTGSVPGPEQPKTEKKSATPLRIDHQFTSQFESLLSESRPTFNSLWIQLAAYAAAIDTNVLGRWLFKAKRLVLPRSFSPVDEPALRHFMQDLRVPEIPADLLPELGAFDGTVLKQVDLVPASEDDAQSWASWLLRDGITEYVTPEKIAALTESVRARFVFHSPALPAPQEVLTSFVNQPEDPRARFVLAPHDLGLWN